MKKLIVLFGLLVACGFSYQLNQAVNTKAQVADTLQLLTAKKADTRARWTNQPDPVDLSLLQHTLPWGSMLEAKFHARGTADTNRLLQLTLPAVPKTICADILQTLMNQRAEGLWLRLDINTDEAPTTLDLAARKQACADLPDISVYFRF